MIVSSIHFLKCPSNQWVNFSQAWSLKSTQIPQIQHQVIIYIMYFKPPHAWFYDTKCWHSSTVAVAFVWLHETHSMGSQEVINQIMRYTNCFITVSSTHSSQVKQGYNQEPETGFLIMYSTLNLKSVISPQWKHKIGLSKAIWEVFLSFILIWKLIR